MELVKKNILSILCGVVALAAIVALFWPGSGMYEDLQAQVTQSKKTYDEVESLRKAPRKLPTLVLEGTGEQATLTRFPNDKVIAFGKAKTQALTTQSKEMLKTVTDNNIHQPLVPGSLPRPSSQAAQIFPQAYFEELGLSADDQFFKTGIPARMKAARPPTNDELTEIAYKIWDERYANRVFNIGGQDTYQAVSDEFQNNVVYDLKEQEQRKRAVEHMVYLDETSLPASQVIQIGRVPTAIDIWFAQTVLWIEQDVAQAIIDANTKAKATNVLDAPVKHLVNLNVPFGPEMYVRAGAVPAGPPGAEAVAAPTDGSTPIYFMSPTGRVCNPIYDVIHFDLVLRVDYRRIPQVMAELERNRLFTILNSSVSAVNSAEERRVGGYVYGNEPVAELALTCEALFLRSWTVDKDNTPPYKNALMPQQVRQSVGAEEGPALPGAVPGGAPGELTGEI